MKIAKIVVFVACAIGMAAHGEVGLRQTSSCGRNNQPACSGSCHGNTALWTLGGTEWCCDNNKNFEGGSCVACGSDGQKPCANVDQSRFGCENGKTIVPFGSAKPVTATDVASTTAVCKSCGGNNQPACTTTSNPAGSCGSRGLWQDGSGFTCCDNNKNFEGGSCVACGSDGQKPCANVDQSRFGCESGKTITPFGSTKPVTTADVASTNAVCKSCGGNNQPACTTTSNPAGSCGSRGLWQDGSGFTCCDNNKNFEGGSCVACGNDGQKPCANVDQSRFGCESGKTIIPFGSAKPVTTADVVSTNAVCKSCGGNNQPSCVSQASVSTNGACGGSRGLWKTENGFTCCDNNKNYDANKNSCVSCGNDGQAPCMNVDKTRFGCESGKTIIPPIVALLSPESGSCSADSWFTVLNTVAKCKSCGGNNQPACLTSSSNGPTSSCGSRSFWQLDYSGVCCDNNKNYENGRCVACGNAGQKPCANIDGNRLGCESGKTISPAGLLAPTTTEEVKNTQAKCVTCGGNGQPSCVFAAGTSSGGSACGGSRKTWDAGNGLLVCCDNNKNYENGRCVACGNAGQKPCANVDGTRFGCESGKTIIPSGSPQPQTTTDVASTSARCQSCGGKNRPECQTRNDTF